jgi:hypothetical protein
MNQDSLNQLIIRGLEAKGLSGYLVRDKSQLLEFPDEYFAEIVLNDAGKIDEAQGVLAKIVPELDAKHQKLDFMVRALWRVVNVEPRYRQEELPHQLKQRLFSLPFIATLKSGSKEWRVGVEITPDAYEDLERAGKCDDQTLRAIVKASLESWLSIGGAGYWDPIREPRRSISSGGVSYALAHGLVNVR